MSRIENIISIIKKESFRFHERIETNMARFSLADPLISLFLLYQLFTYSLYRTIRKFNNGELSGAI